MYDLFSPVLENLLKGLGKALGIALNELLVVLNTCRSANLLNTDTFRVFLKTFC